MLVRLAVGASLVVSAPRMLYPGAFFVFGWVIIVTSLILLVIPWRWHRRFAVKVVRPMTRRAWLFGILAFPLGGFTLFAVLHGAAA